ncbi:MAG: hypothetical protein ACLVJ6_12140 [Merdibacter sp.]
MLTITVPESEYYNEEDSTFVTVKSQTLQLEHSLVSLSKWESRWHKPFLSKQPHSDEEALDYIRCMTITQNVNPLVTLAYAGEPVADQCIHRGFDDRDDVLEPGRDASVPGDRHC